MIKIPTITINEKEYKAQKPKARIWENFCKFDEAKKNLPAEEFLSAHAELIAQVFDGITKDDILDELYLDDILFIYSEIFVWITSLLTAKLAEIPKNVESEEAN
jgi:hypothetical protein